MVSGLLCNYVRCSTSALIKGLEDAYLRQINITTAVHAMMVLVRAIWVNLGAIMPEIDVLQD